ncbi:MAG TPA: MerR family transcriptional regulator [Clostridiales bacterium]|jgi:DNA-binding transcriptional MerR regulator|nr:MerR family transcriptional regulator [Clostridiales bacterium]
MKVKGVGALKYTVNWVEKNMGVTRKTLRIYEEKGLMDKSAIQNPDNKYREYSDEDIERIWCYRLLQGVGYSLNEIVEMTQNVNYDFQASLSEKIKDLERKRFEIEQYIGFAKSLKLTGTFPLPKKMGSIRFEEFMKYARENMNVDADPQMSMLHSLVETTLNKTDSDLTEADLEQIETFISNADADLTDGFIIGEYYTQLAERKKLDVSNTGVQALVNSIYMYYCENLFTEESIERMTPQKFARYIVQIFTSGDISILYERIYGKDGCKFIAEALACFGGYSSVNEIDKPSKY